MTLPLEPMLPTLGFNQLFGGVFDEVGRMRALLIVAVLCFSGCTDAFKSQIEAYGNKHRIELWSGGEMVHEWTSTGKVMSEEHSDGYYFKDDDTGKLVRVTGDLVITPIN